MIHRRISIAAALLTTLMLGSCATTAPRSSTGSPMPGPSTHPRPPGRSTTAAVAAPAVVDTTPSADARRILDSIPEPLPPGERVPPPENAVRDSTAPSDSNDGGAADVPVPTPTRTLGEPEPLTVRDSVTMPIEAIDHSARPDTAQKPSPPHDRRPTPPPPAKPDTCWRVQVAAPVKRAEADAKRDAAESQLLMPMVVEAEKGLFKVRTRDCLSRDSADRLKHRAIDAGFVGAFRFVMKQP